MGRENTKANNYISDVINNFDFFSFVKLLISKRKEIIIIRTVNRFSAKLKEMGSVLSLLNNNKRKQSQYSLKHDFCNCLVLLLSRLSGYCLSWNFFLNMTPDKNGNVYRRPKRLKTHFVVNAIFLSRDPYVNNGFVHSFQPTLL